MRGRLEGEGACERKVYLTHIGQQRQKTQWSGQLNSTANAYCCAPLATALFPTEGAHVDSANFVLCAL